MTQPLTYQVTPETIGAVEDALRLHLGNLLNRIEESPRELAAILLQQAVCASVQPKPEGENNG